MRRVARCWSLCAALCCLGLVGPALALDSGDAKARAEMEVRTVESETGSIQAAAARVRSQRISPARRVAEGEILLRNKDYERAIHVLSQVVELYDQGKAPASANADGLFLLGEAYFQDEQYLAAHRYYGRLLDRAQEATYSPFAGRALSRLVDVALRTGDLESLGPIFARMDTLPDSDATGSLQYARGKAHFARSESTQANAALSSVAPSSPFAPQAQYLLGVVLTKQAAQSFAAATAAAELETPDAAPGAEGEPAAEGAPEATPPPAPATKPNYDAAIAQFRKVTQMQAKTPEHRHVVDLAWMAIGRLNYEMDRHLPAAEAYSHVQRKSPEFADMLYELAWVYVRLGDHQRAQRALEVQRIVDPENLQIADGTLLRADLMLRMGRFDKALALYRSVRGRYDPLRQQVDRFLKSSDDPAVYYDKLVEEQLAGGAQVEALSSTVVDWARKQAREDRAFAVIDDVTRSRDLIKKSELLARKLDAVLSAGTRAKAFPELKASLEVTLGLLNRLGDARRMLALGMDDEASSQVGGELAQIRDERRKLMKRMTYLPTNASDFAQRERSGETQWNQLSQQLQRLTLEADRIQAIVNGLRRILEESGEHGLSPTVTDRQRFAIEIAKHERDLAAHRQRIRDYQDAVETARVQVGFGDQRYVEDKQVRRQFRDLFLREVQLVSAGQDNGDAAQFARDIGPLLAKAGRAEAQLEAIEQKFEQAAQEGAGGLRARIAEEASLLSGYAASLHELDREARTVVGQSAMQNFILVRDRLRDVVLRADVGIVQEAWEVREERRVRVRNLYRERTHEEQKLNDELREVLDDAGDEE